MSNMDPTTAAELMERLRARMAQLTGDPNASLSDMFAAKPALQQATPSSGSALFTLFTRITEAAEIVTQSDRLAEYEERVQSMTAGREAMDGKLREAVQASKSAVDMLGKIGQMLGADPGTSESKVVQFIEQRMRTLGQMADSVRVERGHGMVEAIAGYMKRSSQEKSENARNARDYEHIATLLERYGDDEQTPEQKLDAMQAAIEESQKGKVAAEQATAQTRKMYDDFKSAIEARLEIPAVGLGQILAAITSKFEAHASFRNGVCRALQISNGKTDDFVVEAIGRARVTAGLVIGDEIKFADGKAKNVER
jgi:hypothetical protein